MTLAVSHIRKGKIVGSNKNVFFYRRLHCGYTTAERFQYPCKEAVDLALCWRHSLSHLIPHISLLRRLAVSNNHTIGLRY
jgi:hypothetical protein